MAPDPSHRGAGQALQAVIAGCPADLRRQSVQVYADGARPRRQLGLRGATVPPCIRHPAVADPVRKPYGIPTGAHRSNVLWYNFELLKKAGVSPPTATTPWPRSGPICASQGLRRDRPVPRRRPFPPSSCSRHPAQLDRPSCWQDMTRTPSIGAAPRCARALTASASAQLRRPGAAV